MNIPIDNLVGSVLKVTASEKLDISQDLASKETSSINELLKNHKESESEKENPQNTKDQE
jgi:hypothetical protein